MMLPHGYEGQGPEHSSGRVERFLQLAAENNWTVANVSTAGQYFHILRRQAKWLAKEEIRPLILMTPKSLLRHPLASVEPSVLTDGKFHTVLEGPGTKNTDAVERILLCSGKVAVDLEEKLNSAENTSWLHTVRVEQIYPFPEQELKEMFARFKNAKEIVWMQEEPKNMGSWSFVEPYLRKLAPQGAEIRYIGRPRRSSPSEGDPVVHKKEQNRILTEAITRP